MRRGIIIWTVVAVLVVGAIAAISASKARSSGGTAFEALGGAEADAQAAQQRVDAATRREAYAQRLATTEQAVDYATYAGVATGTSRAAVIEWVGADGVETASDSFGRYTLTWTNRDDSWLAVVFSGDAVESKSQSGLR